MIKKNNSHLISQKIEIKMKTTVIHITKQKQRYDNFKDMHVKFKDNNFI